MLVRAVGGNRAVPWAARMQEESRHEAVTLQVVALAAVLPRPNSTNAPRHVASGAAQLQNALRWRRAS